LEIGCPTTVAWNHDSQVLSITIKDSGEANVVDLIANQLQNYASARVFLSGGMDSETSLIMAKRAITKVEACVFAYTWQDQIVNGHDVANAVHTAKKHDVECYVSTHELDVFFNRDLPSAIKMYNTQSPQVAAHLHALSENCQGTDVCIMGGEVPLVLQHQDKILTAFELDKHGVGPGFFYIINTILPFHRFADLHGIEVIRNPFMMSPEILFAGYKQNLKVYARGQGHVTQSLKTNGTGYRQAYYDSLGIGVSKHLLKRTGFEEVKMHLASVTGNYDEFDKRYRNPYTIPTVKRFRALGDHVALKQCFADLPPITPLNTYSFDW
jgi:hypothetical protein